MYGKERVNCIHTHTYTYIHTYIHTCIHTYVDEIVYFWTKNFNQTTRPGGEVGDGHDKVKLPHHQELQCVLSSNTHVSLSAKLEAMDAMSSSRSISDSVSVSRECSSASVPLLVN